MTFVLAQVLGLIGVSSNIVSVQMKNKKSILFLFMIANLMLSISFILLESYIGAIINMIAVGQTYISYWYEMKGKKFPNYWIPIYIVISLLCGVFTYREIIDILPVICAVLYALSIVQTKEHMIRKITLISTVLWLWYDIQVGAYTAGISNIFFVISGISSMLRLDVSKRGESK